MIVAIFDWHLSYFKKAYLQQAVYQMKAKVEEYFMIWATTWENQQNECAPSKDSDQPRHPPSLIRGFAVLSVDS